MWNPDADECPEPEESPPVQAEVMAYIARRLLEGADEAQVDAEIVRRFRLRRSASRCEAPAASPAQLEALLRSLRTAP